MLLDCASIVYPDHKEGAELFINNLDEMHTKRYKRYFLPSKKAIVCMYCKAFLSLGPQNTPSIAQNSWFSEETIRNVTDVASLYLFIRDLLELPPFR